MDDEPTGPRDDAEGARDDAEGAAPARSASAVAPAVGAVASVVVLLAVRPALVNLYGPFGEDAAAGGLASLAVAMATGLLVAGAAGSLARRSSLVLVAFLAVLVALTLVLRPTRIDRHESFVPRPNERSSCAGLTFDHYPPGTMDGSRDVYCVGLERPLPAG